MKVMIAVTHLLGTGHLSRALTLGRAFAAEGDEVTLISGGMPVPQLDSSGLSLLQLPPLRSDGTDFTRLLEADGALADDGYRNRRIQMQRDALRAANPDVLITELFPFGRRNLSDEFLVLLETAQDLPRKPVVLCSIRDILAPPSKPAKATRADEIIAAHYAAVLVHSDPRATTLERSWPVSDMLRDRLRYTGYVAPPAPGPHPDRAGSGEVLVSAGGGDVGTPLFRAAVEAAALVPDLNWRLLIGGRDALRRIADLRPANCPGNLILEPARPDFRQMLTHAAVSVSMCGYNTALDLLQAGPPAVLVPFDAGNEVEQGLRAQSLTDLPGFNVLPSSQLDGPALARAVQSARATGSRDRPQLRFDGAAQSVAIARQLAEARP
ncbi:glycosyltransferase [Seohaeicola saemankumensis]|nr:glycosyltransferase [Seohaeicola saemankumensis]MCA0871186.1 glycosyltransferase [Seohaeicola saemankumensis]